jgi:hypothetical protein
MHSFKVDFTDDEIKILKKYNLTISNNERNYVYTYYNKDSIYDWGVPTVFQCHDFAWKGSSWKALLYDFSFWYSQLNPSSDDLLNMKSSFSKQGIFSKIQKTNYIGPLNHGLYINGNHTSNHMWWTIVDLISYLNDDFKSNTFLYVHYPSAVEPKEIVNLIWSKEIKMFQSYLNNLGYSTEKVSEYIENVKKLNTIYRKITPNYYLFIVDREYDLYNAVSRIKKSELFLMKQNIYTLTLNNIIDFKKEIYYDDFFL